MTADAPLLPPLPPPYSATSTSASTSTSGGDACARDSVRHLDEIGVETVLGAMIEQKRRASYPSFPAATLRLATDAVYDDDDDDGPATPRTPTRSEVFLKAR